MRNSRVLITQHNCLSPFGKNLEEMLHSLQSEKTYISSFQSTLQKISIKEKFVGLLKDQIEVESLLFKDLEVVSINTEEKIKEAQERYNRGEVVKMVIDNSNTNEYESETALDNTTFDYTIDNNGSIKDLIEKVREILIKEKLL